MKRIAEIICMVSYQLVITFGIILILTATKSMISLRIGSFIAMFVGREMRLSMTVVNDVKIYKLS